jgi:hypothetical protein
MREFVNVPFMKAAAQHGSASIVVIAMAEITGYVINLSINDSMLKTAVIAIEEFVVVGQYAWLSILLAYELWKASPWSDRAPGRVEPHG